MRETIEQDVERVLRGLGSVEASRGLEGRVLAAVAEVRRTTRVNVRGWMLAGAVGCTCGVAIVTAVVGSGRFVTRPVAINPRAQIAETRGISPKEYVTHGFGVTRSHVPATVHPPKPSLDGAPLGARGDAEEALAASEMNAPSMPEPKVPLSAQEKLLRKAAGWRGVEALAEVNEAQNATAETSVPADSVQDSPVPVKRTEAHAFFAAVGDGMFAGMKPESEKQD